MARNAGILGGGELIALTGSFRAASAFCLLVLLVAATLLVVVPVRGASPVRLTSGDFWTYRMAGAFDEDGIHLSLSGNIRYDVIGPANVQAGAQFYDVDRVRVTGNGTFSGTIGITVSGNWSQSGERWWNRSDLGTVRELTTLSFNTSSLGFPLEFNTTTDLRYEPPAGETYRPQALEAGLTWSRYTEQVDNETGDRTPMWWNVTVGDEASLTVQLKTYSAFPVTVRTSDDPEGYTVHSIDPAVGMPVKIAHYADPATLVATLELVDHRYAQQRDEVLFTLAMSLAIVAAVGVIAAVMAAVLLRSRRARPPGGPAAPPPGPQVLPPLGPPGGGAPP